MATRRGSRASNNTDEETKRHTSAAPPPATINEIDEDDEDWGDEDDDTLSAMNDPSVANLGPAPMLGGGMTRAGDLFGNEAVSIGRATSPKLYNQAAQFPTVTQLRVWRWENGIPVGLGAIDAYATEEDMVREFFEAMPKPGSGRMQFKLRPIDIRGEEMGKEITLVISEHHAALQQIRRAKKAEAEEASMGNNQGTHQQQHPFILDRGDDGAAAGMASEMSRMFEKAVEAADHRAMALEQALLEERERLRSEDDKRAQERIDLATNAAAGVQAITERMMRDEANRADRAMKSQSDQSQMLLTTLTQIFASAQSQQASISETARMADQQRLEQERQYAERVRMEQEERRRRDIAEMEERRKAEQNRLEDERKQLRDQRDHEMKQLEARLSREKEEIASRMERERIDAHNTLALAEKRLDRDKAEQELKAVRSREDEERKLAREREEYSVKIERERLEWQHRWKMESEERERRDRLERDERERKTKIEQEMMMFRQQEIDRKMAAESELQRQRDSERQRAHEMAVKQMEMSANRDREHAERMMQMARLEMENQRQAADSRIRAEKEDQERREQERLRQHERLLKDSELQSQKDREHAERMMQLTQMQIQNKAFGGLGELLPKAKELLGTLGIDPMDLLDRVLNPAPPPDTGGGGGSAWADAIPKVLGSLAEMGKVAIEAKAKSSAPPPQQRAMLQQPMMMPGMMPGMMPMGVPMPGMPGIPNLAMQNQMVPARQPQEEVGGDEDSFMAAAAGEEQDQAVPDDAMPAPNAAAEQEEPKEDEPSTMQMATEAGLSMPTQKRARKALRLLVRKLGNSKEDDWYTSIATSISNEVGIYHYVKAVTIRSALKEGGADEALTDRICDAMRSSGMIPDDVPYE